MMTLKAEAECLSYTLALASTVEVSTLRLQGYR